jgi:penicillin-binding protein 1A
MNRMLQAVIEDGTGRAAKIGRPAAGKTGTSEGFRDAWFIGYSADLLAGVWLGNDDASPMKGVTGGGLPARLWRDFMIEAHGDSPPRPLIPGGTPGAGNFWDRLFGG